MTRVYLSLGSNIDREYNLAGGLNALACKLGHLTLSQVYESEAVGFDGAPFLNLVVTFETTRKVRDLVAFFHQVEADHGRVRGKKRCASRTLDIDILTYGDVVGEVDGVILPRNEILRYAFVLKPLCDLAGDEKHPVLHKTYCQLLTEADFSEQPLWPVDFHWPP
jgi:2-amino-4-hydroxy-6-hydroxymethyldihydropteridine diphosphokinase